MNKNQVRESSSGKVVGHNDDDDDDMNFHCDDEGVYDDGENMNKIEVTKWRATMMIMMVMT